MKLKTLRIMAIITGILGSTLFNRFLEGGALFMSLILICLLLSIYFMTKAFYKIKTNTELSKKMISLVNDCGILGISLGFLSSNKEGLTLIDTNESKQKNFLCTTSHQ